MIDSAWLSGSSGYPGDTVSLSASFTDPGTADTFSYIIDWGDGNTDTGNPGSSTIDASHVYTTPGNYTVTLTVNDDDDGEGTWWEGLTIDSIAPTISGSSTTSEGDSYSLDLSAAGPVDSWTIDWGDGTIETGVSSGSASHVYIDEGSSGSPTGDYTITATAHYQGSDYTADPLTVTVNNIAPWIDSAWLSGSSGYPGDTVSLSASFTDPGTVDTFSYVIDWGDGNTDPGTPGSGTIDASHIYTTPGSYTVALTVSDDDNGEDVWSQTVDVVNTAPMVMDDSYSIVHDTTLDVPADSVLANDSDAENQPLTATLNTGPAHAASFILNADGSFNYEPESGWSGTDSFTYTVSDGFESSAAATVTIEVTNDAPVFDASPYAFTIAESAAIGSVVGAVSATDNDDTTLTYSLETTSVPFTVDGTTGELKLAGSLNYQSVSQYALEIHATDSGGLTDTAWVAVDVGGARLDEASAGGWEGGTIDFLVKATPNGGLIESIEIDVNSDGVFDLTTTDYSPVIGGVLIMEADVLHLIGSSVDDGDYPAIVRITTDDGLTSEFEFDISIGNLPPDGDFTDSHHVNPGEAFTLSITVSDPGPDTITTTEINWGDGTVESFPASSGSFSHVYTAEGVYEITFSMTDEDGTWTSTSWAVVGDVDLPPPPPDAPQVNAAMATLHDPSTLEMKLELTDVVPYSGTVVSISWDLDGDGQFGDSFGTNVILAASGGVYFADAQITDSGGFVGEAAFTFFGEGIVTAEATKGTYRTLFVQQTPNMPPSWQVHHIYEQKEFLADRLRTEKGINVHEVSRLRAVHPTIHGEITAIQSKWWKEVAENEFDGDIRRAYREIDLDRFILHAEKLNADFSRYFMKSGQGLSRVAQISKNITKDGHFPAIKAKRGSRLAKLGVAIGAVALFDLLARHINMAVDEKFWEQDHTAPAKFDSFMTVYENALNEATGPHGAVSYTTASLLQTRAIDYLLALGYDRNSNPVVALDSSTGAWVDANIPH